MDFLLTPTGDISFEVYDKVTSPFEISFIHSKTKTLNIKFHTDEINDFKVKDSTLTVSFTTYTPEENKTISLTNEDELYEQQIRIRLMTTIGEMGSDSNLGSYLERFRHMFIDT